MSARYQFLPWVRAGAATAYANADTLRPVLERTDGKPLTDLPVALRVNTTPVDVPLRLYGPGDVTGIDPRVVIRTDPPPGSADLEPNYLACDRVRHARLPVAVHARRGGLERRGCGRGSCWSWCGATEACASAPTGRPLPVLSAAVAELPDLLESWTWAHAQVVQADVADPSTRSSPRTRSATSRA